MRGWVEFVVSVRLPTLVFGVGEGAVREWKLLERHVYLEVVLDNPTVIFTKSSIATIFKAICKVPP